MCAVEQYCPLPHLQVPCSHYLRPPVVVLNLEGHPNVVEEQGVLFRILEENELAVTRAQVICAAHEEDLASS